MDQGLVNNPKDLERMQHELVSLERRITSLEDEELEVMERLEEAQNALDSLLEQLRAADERLVSLGRGPGPSGPARSRRSWPGSTPSGSPRRPTSRPTCWPSTTGSGSTRAGSARPRCGPGSAAAAGSPSTTPSWR